MDEKEIMQWDLVPPDMASNDLFFTEESYKKFSIETDLTKQILSKYMELGPYTYTNDNELPEAKFDKNTASQRSPDSISEVSGLKKNSECITSNVDDEIENGNNPLPKAMESVKILDDENSSNSVFEKPASCDNSVKFGSPPTSGEPSQNMSYGRKRLHYPRYSLLSNSEQNFYVSKLILYKKSRPEPGCPEYARFLKLHKKVQKEQNEFTGYLQKASVEFKEDYAFLQDIAVQYMQKKHEGILKCLQEHSSFYHPIDKVPIITNYCQTHQLQSVKILLQMGEVPVNFPFLNKKMKTVLDYEILQQRFPTDRTQLPNMESFNCHQVCSKDSNAQRLAQKYQCDIVLSSSVFKCLVDNHAPHFEKSWDIPITVQEYQPEVPRKVMHKVIFLDKPFHRQQTTRDINTIFHKISLAARVLHPDHMSTYSFQPSPTLPRHSTNDKDETNKDKYANELDLMDVSLLETFATSTSKTNLGTKTEKPGKERRNSTETSSLENKTVESSVCEIKDTNKGLSEQSSSHSVQMNSNLKPDEHNDIIAPPQISTIEKSTGDNQPEEQSQTDMISVSSSEKTLEGISKSPNQNFNEELFEKNKNDCFRKPGKMCINEKLDSTNAYSVKKNPGSSNQKSSSFEEANAATISNEGDFKSNKKQDKQPGGIERKNNKNKGNIDGSADEKELSTASGIPKVEPAEEDSDSSPELVIHFESSDTDEAQAEKDKISVKLPTINRPQIVNNQVPDTSGSPIPNLSASPSALIIDTPASPTPVAPVLPTPIQISYTPRSPIADLSASSSTLVIDAPTSPIPENSVLPTPDSTSLQPGSPIADLSASPSALIIDTPASTTPDAPASPTLDTPASLMPDTPVLPTSDSTSLQIPYPPGSPIADLSASPSALIIDTPASPTPATPASPLSDTKILPTLDTPASPTLDTPASPTPDAPASPTPDAPASLTPVAPVLPTPIQISYTPRSPIADLSASPSTLVIDAPTSPIPENSILPTPDSTSLQLGSPIADLSASPSALIIDTPASTTPDAPASPTPDTPVLPTSDSTSLQIPYPPGSPIADLSASPSALIIDTPASPTPATPASPLSDTKILPTLDTPASPTPDAPASPTPDAPASPTPDAPASPTPDAPASPTLDAPASLIPDAPASPTPDGPASPIPDAPGSPLSMQENLLEPFERAMVLIPTESNVNVFEFDDIKPKSPIISDPGSSIDVDNTNNLSKKRKHHTAFELGPLDSILEKQEELLKTTNRIKSASAGTKATATISKMKSECTVKQPNNILPEIKFDENPEDYLKPESGKNITYCIWNFGDLRLLVRCKYSAVKKKKKSKEFVYLMPKLEYQVGFGHEQTTISEASQMWISSLIRHNCSINRIRINAFSSDVMMEETFSFHQIRQLYNPAPANNFMYNLFQKLQSLKPGSYFLSHTEGENVSVISQVIPEKSHPLTFDLKKMYPENIPVHLPKVIPWVPLDPNLLTQFHEFFGRVPCTFHPPDVKKQTVKAKKKWKKKKNQNQ